MAISAVLLAYKEAENLKVLFPKIKQQLDKIGEEYEIIIVDTMKPLDDTPAVCKKFGARYLNQNFRILEELSEQVSRRHVMINFS